MRAFIDDIISNFRQDPRASAVRVIARNNDWRFTDRKRFKWEPLEMSRFELFGGQKDKRLTAVLSFESPGIKGKFRVYDYVNYSQVNMKKITTVFEYSNPKKRFSQFSITPKGSFSRFRELFIVPEMLFATTPEFNRRYEINAEDREMIKIDLNEYFLDYVGDEPNWTYEGYHHYIIGYQPGKVIPVSSIEQEIERFVKMCGCLEHS